MAAGNKKKKKPAANPARGFATTSTVSKSKVENAASTDSPDASGTATPQETPESSNLVNKTSGSTALCQEKALHELSPEDFEVQLETSELQQVVEKHAAKVRKDVSRQVSRLLTEKRLLRGAAEFVSVKDWLPEELMHQVLDYTFADFHEDRPVEKKQSLLLGDDLVARVWSLRTVLIELQVPSQRVIEVISYLLQHPPSEDNQNQVWGLIDALDWLSLHCEHGELLDYDVQRSKVSFDVENETVDVAGDSSEETAMPAFKQETQSSSSMGNGAVIHPDDDSLEVSDVESDLEPEELLSTYLRTKAKLYEINPDSNDSLTKKSKARNGKVQGHANIAHSRGERKLCQKLQKIEQDVLFDQREADAQWAMKKIDLARGASERRKLELSTSTSSAHALQPEQDRRSMESSAHENVEISEESDEDALLGEMFSVLNGDVDQPKQGESIQSGADTVTVRSFGRIAGITPQRILEETCRARDSRCTITYKHISPTTYACRHSVVIRWTKPQEAMESGYIPSVSVLSGARNSSISMLRVATPDSSQSEAYVATAALFLIFSHSPKEEKSHLRLPPAYRDLWDEFSELKREYVDAADRTTVKELRELIHNNVNIEDDMEDEVVFNASSRRLNGAVSGTTTPMSRPQTPRGGLPNDTEYLKDIWARKAATTTYQRMLLARMNLPMFHSKAIAIQAIEQNQITIVVGDTGSGKSTQVPHFILERELSQGRQCKIYCTEPRRISAISLAQRVSEELGEHKGDLGTSRSLVGYAIRLESHVTAQTRLVYATVGVVLRMLESLDGLKEITHLVLDEVHERNIDTDFLLIVLQTLVVKRPDLKVVLMSATVDAGKFSHYLGGAPIVDVPGRTFPVQAQYLEDAIELTGHVQTENGDGIGAGEEDETDSEGRQEKSASEQLAGYSKQTVNTLKTLDEYRIDHALIVKVLVKVSQDPHYQQFSRAMLIFLPGIAEIRQLNDLLLGHPAFSHGWRIHALHSTFSSEDQQAAFDIPPDGIRKIVIATNIAETGITIPDVTCVIDTGKHREMRFDERRQISKLTQSFIARANAKQRRGRAGRVQEGICFHLFTKYRFETLMAEQQTPEMLRLSLQDLIMRVKICKLGGVEDALSRALDPPSNKNVRRAVEALIEVGALNEKEELTALGNQLARLPLDAQLGKLVLLGAVFGCLDFSLTIAAALTSKSPFLSPMYAKKQAESIRLGFKRGDSDLLTLYNAYSAWRRICTSTTPGPSEYRFCQKNFLNLQNLVNIEELKGQILSSLVDAGFVTLEANDRSALAKVRGGSRRRVFVSMPDRFCNADDNDLVASTVVGWSLYPKIVKQEGKGWRNIANNQTLALHPTSVNKFTISPNVRYLSFYSIMQSSSKFTNAQETSPMSDFALVLLAGEAVFHMYAGVIVIDGNRLKFKVRDWKTMIVLKTLRLNLKEGLARGLKFPGRNLGDKQKRWMDLIAGMFEERRTTSRNSAS